MPSPDYIVWPGDPVPHISVIVQAGIWVRHIVPSPTDHGAVLGVQQPNEEGAGVGKRGQVGALEVVVRGGHLDHISVVQHHGVVAANDQEN